MKRILPYLFAGMLSVALPQTMRAGNVPQYKLGYELKETFPHLENPTVVEAHFARHALFFPEGVSAEDYAYTGQGFPIGFTFRFGGQEFTQFAVDNMGAIYLGNDQDGIVFRGQNTKLFMKNLPRDLDKADEFYIGMLVGGLLPEFKSAGTKEKLKPQVGFSLLGDEGDRVLVVEYLNMAPEGEKTSKAGHYDLQIRLYEKDNHAEIAFNEVVTPTKGYSFITGMRGFEIEDALLITSPSLSQTPKISENKYTEWDEAGCRIIWNCEDEYDNEYKPVYSFYPETDQSAPDKSPTDLVIEQIEDTALVTLKRGENAPATVLLYSESPITGDDLPTDGATFRSQGKFGDFVTTIGNATVLYYGDKEEIEVTLPSVEPSKDYYFAALSANGYPAFNRSNFLTGVLSTAQAAPKWLNAEPIAKNSVKLSWEADDPVIIAMVDNCGTYGMNGYNGEFGRPNADAKVGDEIQGGGKVIYVGDASEFNWEEMPDNGLVYFGAWTVREGRVSALAAPAHGTAPATLPYEAMMERYPSYVVPENFTTEIKSEEKLGVYNRLGDGERCLRMQLVAGVPVEFYLPEIDFGNDSAELSFEFGMETDRGVGAGDGGVEIPLGYEAGYFGWGALEIKAKDADGVKVVKSIKEYNGEMVSNGDDGFITGSSSLEPVTVELTGVKGKASIGMKAEAEVFSSIYMRNIRISRAGESGVESAVDVSPGVIYGGNGEIVIISPVTETVVVYSIDGRRSAVIEADAGETVSVAVAPGIYIVKGKKIFVK